MLFTTILLIIGTHAYFCQDSIKNFLESWLVKHRQYFPSINAKIEAELAKTTADLKKELHEPSGTQSIDDAVNFDNKKVQSTKLSGSVYAGEYFQQALAPVFGKIAEKLSYVNPLHSDTYRASREMEAKVIKFCKTLMHAPDTGTGMMTSGGTESILLACKAYRDYWRTHAWFSSWRTPNIIAPSSVHAAFDKAGQLMNIQIVKVPVNNAGEADASLMSQYINRNTICIVGSTPSFPHGIVDPIPHLNTIAQKHGIPLHVDACLGGFVAPFLKLKSIDFKSEGVTSISMDTHKYGLAPKGSSVLLFRDKQYFRYAFSLFPNWEGGIYATPTLAGSRPGFAAAATWAAIDICRREYSNNALHIREGVEQVKKQVKESLSSYIEVIGDPKVCVVGLKMTSSHEPMKIYEISDLMSKRGWNLNNLQNPPSIHICITSCHFPISHFVVDFIKDLKECTEIAMENKEKSKEGQAAVYGIAAKVPRILVEELMCRYLELVYEN